jgi:lipid-A-disaccharide synthase-like uncharacterized protein
LNIQRDNEILVNTNQEEIFLMNKNIGFVFQLSNLYLAIKERNPEMSTKSEN